MAAFSETPVSFYNVKSLDQTDLKQQTFFVTFDI